MTIILTFFRSTQVGEKRHHTDDDDESVETKLRKYNGFIEPIKANTHGFLVTHPRDTDRHEALDEAITILRECVAKSPLKYKPGGEPCCFQRRFVKTKHKQNVGFIFIETNVEDPFILVDDMFTDMLASRVRKTKLCRRLRPVRVVSNMCKDIIVAVQDLVATFVSKRSGGRCQYKLHWLGPKGTKEEQEKFDEGIKKCLPSELFELVTKNTSNDGEEILLLEMRVLKAAEVCMVTLLDNCIKFSGYNLKKESESLGENEAE